MTVGAGRGEDGGVHEGTSAALIDTFSSSKRGAKASVVLKSGIPGQTGCLYGDGQGEGELCRLWTGMDGGNGYGVTSQCHGPHNTLRSPGLGILRSGNRFDHVVYLEGQRVIPTSQPWTDTERSNTVDCYS